MALRTLYGEIKLKDGFSKTAKEFKHSMDKAKVSLTEITELAGIAFGAMELKGISF